MFRLSDQPIDADACRRELDDPACGAYTSFEGWVRNHNEGQGVLHLEYEAYPTLAISEGEKILAEARERFDIVDAACVHRVGDLAIGDMAVWVGVISHHRDAAFKACRFVIDELKDRVPIWKHEHYESGESVWVDHP